MKLPWVFLGLMTAGIGGLLALTAFLIWKIPPLGLLFFAACVCNLWDPGAYVRRNSGFATRKNREGMESFLSFYTPKVLWKLRAFSAVIFLFAFWATRWAQNVFPDAGIAYFDWLYLLLAAVSVAKAIGPWKESKP